MPNKMLMIANGCIIFGVNCRHAYEMAWENEHAYIYSEQTLLYVHKYQHNTQIYFFEWKLSLMEMYYFELCTDVLLFLNF